MKHLSERQEQVEEKPDINHFNIGSFGQSIGDAYEPRNIGLQGNIMLFGLHSCQNQHNCQVHSNNSLKEERLEVYRDMAHNVEKHCWYIHGEHIAEESAAKHNKDPYALPFVRPLDRGEVLHHRLPNKILCQLHWAVVVKRTSFKSNKSTGGDIE